MAGKLFDILDVFAGNLSHANKEIRLSTLRILCRYEPIFDEHLKKKRPVENTSETYVSETNLVNGHHNDVCYNLCLLQISFVQALKFFSPYLNARFSTFSDLLNPLLFQLRQAVKSFY